MLGISGIIFSPITLPRPQPLPIRLDVFNGGAYPALSTLFPKPLIMRARILKGPDQITRVSFRGGASLLPHNTVPVGGTQGRRLIYLFVRIGHRMWPRKSASQDKDFREDI